jgi:glutathione S-transferase
MKRLYVLPAKGWGVLNPSPFCMKAELYLRMANIEHQTVETVSLANSPKRKLPYLEDDGRTVSDSGFIIEELERANGPLGGPITPEQHAAAHPIRRMLEESLYFAIVYSRWQADTGWPHTRQLFFGALPLPVRALLPVVARRGVLKQLHQQGYGRHSMSEMRRMADDDLTALARFLDGKQYALGDRLSMYDATVLAFIENVLSVNVPSTLKEKARTLPSLVAYADRLRPRYAQLRA